MYKACLGWPRSCPYCN